MPQSTAHAALDSLITALDAALEAVRNSEGFNIVNLIFRA